MNNIVARLRTVQGDNEDAREAAAEIERLRAALQDAADVIRDHDRGDPADQTGWFDHELLRAWLAIGRALEPKP